MTVPVRVVESEADARRAARWLQRARIPADVSFRDDRFVVLVPTERRAEATELLDQRSAGPAPIPAGRVGLGERLFNVENLMTLILGAAGLILLALGIAVAFAVTAGIGVVASLAVVIAGLVYFHFSGSHGAVKQPRRVTPKAGPVSQDLFVTHDYRRAWLTDQIRGRDRIKKAQAKNDSSESP